MYIENFLSYLRFEKRYSEKTLIAYATDLRQFSEFLLKTYEIDNPVAANHLKIRSFIVDQIDQKISPRSINRKISTLKSFYKFLKRRGLTEGNPMLKVISPKTSKKLPVYVENEAMKTLLNHDFFTDDFAGHRDHLIIELFYNTGIRLAELMNIKVNDVDLAQKMLKVLGKGNKERIIPFDNQLGNIISKYIQMRNENFPENNFLIITDKGEPLYPKFVYRKVKHYLTMVTTVEKKSPHVLRHTFATHLTNQGADLNAIKELLGHSSLAATQVYTHNNIQKLKDIYKSAHPKA